MIRAVLILAGGAGTRLAPLSSEENPKQFLKLFDGQSLLQRTFDRAIQVTDAFAIFVSTNEQYRDKVLEQLPELPPENVITEPARRNTAPAITLSCFEIEKRFGNCTIACLPSDHYIGNEKAFVRVLDRVLGYAEVNEVIVTVGIKPTEPNTGYGYLELGEKIERDVVRLIRFTEKPTLKLAEEFLRAGNYAWNAGILAWRAVMFRAQIEAEAPTIARVKRSNYESMPSISIDYALMERARNVVTIRGDFDWSDVGSFEALRKVGVNV
jgi:mannose-1-phosphate guanylyltransferase